MPFPACGGPTTVIPMQKEKGEALAKLADLIERIISPEQLDNNPIPLRFRQHQPPNDLRASA